MRRKYLIAFTGIDGSGKTTQADLFVSRLRRDYSKVSFIRCKWESFILRPLIAIWKKRKSSLPADSKTAVSDNKVRKQELLKNPFTRYLWLGLFFVDYGLQILIKIRSRLLSKGFIVSDRIFYDSVIDQAVNLGERKDWLLDSLDSLWMRMIFPEPDMVIYIDCPEDVAFERKNDEYTPNIEYLMDRRKLFLKLADKYNWVKIDGILPVDEIADMINNRVYKELGI